MKKKNRGKEEKKREEYGKPHTRRQWLSYWKIGLTSMAATQELLSGMPLVPREDRDICVSMLGYYLTALGKHSVVEIYVVDAFCLEPSVTDINSLCDTY